MIDCIYNAEPSRKARELPYGTAPPKINKMMVVVLEGMTREERAVFIGSEQGPEWREKVELLGGHGEVWHGAQPENVMALFERMRIITLAKMGIRMRLTNE